MLVVLFYGLGNAVALAVGVPQLIKEHSDSIPDLIKNPNTLWVAFTTAITAIAVLLILAPWGRQKAATPPTIEAWIVRELTFYMGLIMTAARTGDQQKMNTEVLNAIDHGIPTFLQSATTKSERAAYEAAIQSARDGGITEPSSLFPVAVSHVTGIIAKRLTARTQDSTATRSSSPGASPTHRGSSG